MADSIGQTQSPSGLFSAAAHCLAKKPPATLQTIFNTASRAAEHAKNIALATIHQIDNAVLRTEVHIDKVLDPTTDFISRQSDKVGRAVRLWGGGRPQKYDFSKCKEKDLTALFNMAKELHWDTKRHIIKSTSFNISRMAVAFAVFQLVNPFAAIGVFTASIVAQAYLRRRHNVKLAEHFNEEANKFTKTPRVSIEPLKEEFEDIKPYSKASLKEDLQIWDNLERDPLRFSLSAIGFVINPVVFVNAIIGWASIKDAKKNGRLHSRATEIMVAISKQHPELELDKKYPQLNLAEGGRKTLPAFDIP
jgi:DNA-binding transcriptional regulator YdaS (Cro superfamily)